MAFDANTSVGEWESEEMVGLKIRVEAAEKEGLINILVVNSEGEEVERYNNLIDDTGILEWLVQ